MGANTEQSLTRMLRAADKWLMGYLLSVLRRRRAAGTRRLIFCVADHFEPFRGGGVSAAQARQDVHQWCRRYAQSAGGFRDADGRPPRHTCFYPEEEYDAGCVDVLTDFCRRGLGEVEIHLHHRHDTPEGLRQKLVAFRDRLHGQHGLLGSGFRSQESGVGGQDVAGTQHPEPRPLNPYPSYAFVHGNWALCNSRPDGDWCGVNEELAILADTGCYADLTFPSAPSPTQPRRVNSIYIARDRPGHPRGADCGRRVRAGFRVQDSGGWGEARELLLIQGPLGLDWGRRKWGVVPRLENAELSGANLPSLARADLWARQCIHVLGRPDWVFVKVHTHGLVPSNAEVLLGPAMRRLHEGLAAKYNDGRNWTLHYVTAREMFNLVAAATSGASGDPGPWRDWAVSPPPVATGC